MAERLGHAPGTALSLAAVLAGIAPPAPGRPPGPVALGPAARLVAGNPPLADRGDGVGVPPGPAEAYLHRAFGPRFGEARAAMRALAARQDPLWLEERALALFAAFAPEPGDGLARGRLDPARIAGADCRG
ncbi:hypothetical protein [Falsiroseomonas ponticola]|uniref:hypothetical protein n=1 Tax=Falsiroseomonas ponticola TaxID=2786951 RepID=UPI0019344BCB|nr:hypothetical protein [Roseomonas ponticola]